MKTKPSAKLCGLRKNHSSQHSLMNMFEKWKYSLDKRKYVGAVFTVFQKPLA